MALSERIEAFLEAYQAEVDKQQSEWGRLMVEVMRVQAEDAATERQLLTHVIQKTRGLGPPSGKVGGNEHLS